MKSLPEIKILFEDKNYIIVNKPAGLVVHPDGKTKEPALTDWILKKFPKTAGVGEPLKLSGGEIIERPGIVHRLDRETSGALVMAKNQAAFADLKGKFQAREVEKKYHAFVYGKMKEGEGEINRPIGRSNKNFKMWSAQRGARGELREAVTYFKVLARSPDATLIEVSPKTGRTHQIRVHFKAINHPIVADKLYAPKREPLFGFTRPALHSRSISFTDSGGKKISAEAPYPEDFARAAAEIGKFAKEEAM